ncbi:hypothetical protein Droror1_Dr00007798 [Drosera rotundifolia]
MMKNSMASSPPLVLLSDASTSGSSTQSRNDQELPRSNPISNGSDCLLQNMFFRWCLPHGFNLRVVGRQVLAELVGTFLLMYCVYGIIASTQVMGLTTGLVEYALTAGSAIIVVVYCIGSISGAHVNPAVTIAFASLGHFPWLKVLLYVGAQVLGSIMGTYVGKLVYGVAPELLTTQPNHSSVAAFWGEFMATFIIMFLAASLGRDANSVGQLSGIVMGIGIALGVLITGPISGGSMNPARSLGPAIISGKLDHLWIYLVAPTTGAVLGVLMVHILCLQWSLPRLPIPTSIVSN